jgi:hypothetical protein
MYWRQDADPEVDPSPHHLVLVVPGLPFVVIPHVSNPHDYVNHMFKRP